jgi:hypothetical protein
VCRMIHLQVDFDSSLVDAFNSRDICRLGERWAKIQEDFRVPEDLSGAFDLRLWETNNLRKRILGMANYLRRRGATALTLVTRLFPDVPTDMHHRLTVILVPAGKLSYGPRDGVQLFALEPKASAFEAYLFLAHVFYHEISALVYTDRARALARERRGAADFRAWIRLLMRNEGIANVAVVEEMRRYRDRRRGYKFHYFHHAQQIDDLEAITQAIRILIAAFHFVTDEHVVVAGQAMEDYLKRDSLSVINILGTYMGMVIEARYGADILRNVYGLEAEGFFDQYVRTGDYFASEIARCLV